MIQWIVDATTSWVHMSRATRSALEIAWRRRWLLVVPVLIVLPLSIAAAFIVPSVYASRALLLLQESASDSLAPREATAYGETVRDRIAGLQAFLKSDHVLIPVIEAGWDHKTEINARRMLVDLEELRRRLSLELIGNDFLQFQLRGSKREELRPILEAIISRFLGSLMAPEETVLSATQLVKERSAKELETAERKLAEARRQIGEVSVGSTDGRALDYRKRATRDKAKRLSEAQPTGSVTDTATAPGATEANREKAASNAVAMAAAGGSISAARLTQLQMQRDEAKRLVEMYNLRFSAPTPRVPLHILKGPERIRVIDPPTDPDVPQVGKRTIVLAGLLAGGFIALAIGAAAELLDARVWRVEQFKKMTGVAVLAELPLPRDDAPELVPARPAMDEAPAIRAIS
jgi:uncharacterized protein involved in exopolysaccharide biosynthesis